MLINTITYHRSIKIKPIDFKKLILTKKLLNLKLVIILEYQKKKKLFAKGYAPNWSEEVFRISKIKNTVPWTYIISDLNGEEID